MSEKMYELLLQLNDSIHNNNRHISAELGNIKLEMQRNTDSLVHHEERTSLLHEEVNILRRSYEELMLIQENCTTQKKTKKEIVSFWFQVLAGVAQIATIGSLIAYVYFTK